MTKTMKAYRKPGKVQTTVVFLLGVLLLGAAVYGGVLLMLEEPIGSAFDRLR